MAVDLKNRLELFPFTEDKTDDKQLSYTSLDVTDSFNTTYSPSYYNININLSSPEPRSYKVGRPEKRNFTAFELVVIGGCLVGIYILAHSTINLGALTSFFAYLR